MNILSPQKVISFFCIYNAWGWHAYISVMCLYLQLLTFNLQITLIVKKKRENVNSLKCLHSYHTLLSDPPHPHSYVADAWTSRWANSEHKSDYGQLKLTAGNFYGDAEKDKGKSKAAVMQ